MAKLHPYYVYIMSNIHRTVLYIGVTNDIMIRVAQHKSGKGSIFTEKYKCHYLLYFEEFQRVQEAISREKQLKNWKRIWKHELIRENNPELKDLSQDW
jgi:putative endonuclease